MLLQRPLWPDRAWPPRQSRTLSNRQSTVRPAPRTCRGFSRLLPEAAPHRLPANKHFTCAGTTNAISYTACSSTSILGARLLTRSEKLAIPFSHDTTFLISKRNLRLSVTIYGGDPDISRTLELEITESGTWSGSNATQTLTPITLNLRISLYCVRTSYLSFTTACSSNHRTGDTGEACSLSLSSPVYLTLPRPPVAELPIYIHINSDLSSSVRSNVNARLL